MRIEGVGLQAHLSSEPTPTTGGGSTPSLETLTDVLQSFSALDVDTAYTELDVRFNLPATPEKLQEQADTYATVTQSCLDVWRCREITTWVSSKPLRPALVGQHANSEAGCGR